MPRLFNWIFRRCWGSVYTDIEELSRVYVELHYLRWRELARTRRVIQVPEVEPSLRDPDDNEF
jgi:hypothetical protein